MYIAHTREIDSEVQSLKEHLEKTAAKARQYGDSFNNGDYAHICGLLHDLGKYSREFQNKIKNNLDDRVDHSTAGAIEIDRKVELFGKLLAYCIAGHHGGLPDGGHRSDTAVEVTLNGRLKRTKQLPVYSDFEKEINLDDILPVNMPNIKPLNKGGFSIAFFIRMIYSCLVDADFLDTEEFINGGQVDRSIKYDFRLFNNKLNTHIGKFHNKEREINKKRAEILENCIEKSKQKKGLYTLTVPTGGGKTLSSLAFAMGHVLEHGMDRIIYVIPYTSIIEQTGKTFKDILGFENVLEHHSNFDFKDDEYSTDYKLKLASENWDIPIVVTTNVQFFESLFGNRSSKCRKLHNLANSVIIFDEAQMIPTQYLTPCIASISELVKNYEATCILCSATQPSLKDRFPKEISISEICDNTEELYHFFKRIKVVNRGKMEVDQVSEELNNCNQVLCIVNNKKHAKEIFAKIKGEGIFHLSTRMCPKHRKDVLAEIKQRLEDKLPCKVVSTQLIEAGVDVDFPIVYRAMAGIDSIVQAGGRCNRERNLETGIVYLFEPESTYTKNMPSTIKRPIAVAKTIMERFEDILSPEAIKTYFDELYVFEGEQGLDIKNIFEKMEKGAEGCNFNFNFKQVAEQFKLIEENTVPVIIELDKNSMELVNKLRFIGEYKSILRAIQPYTVNVYENEFEKMSGANMIDVIKEGIYVLKDINMYSEKTGLEFTVETGIGIFV
ncbi:CRISPR-associated endonuclease/helicase Cas3 [Geosporobacter subterraneus DSM 17957]|uniref:CRISPR-associated endonuclease/helicase Cas3 n=1 Tax=Geosporobacter subterraneus DSM 17957 TaxID=1121919 RepID=A0A1M6F1F1_9FIRM|nr:CRISPR-associated helicase Cas3' [Geosporobacter subterraneus]SHI91513.1 CRISPR-associated endonuclease/helicase Cas3 [Geosporobacter subterraneus DSM 17957]